VIEPKFPIGSLCRETSDVVQPRRSILAGPLATGRAMARHGVKEHGASVSQTVRETVAAVAELTARQQPRIGVMLGRVAEHLGLDKSSASRRVAAAIKGGYLFNTEERKGRPACLELGEPLPQEREVLPSPAVLQ
jgi:hypothetical protein